MRLDIDASRPQLKNVQWESLTATGPPPRHLGHSYRTPFSRALPGGAVADLPAPAEEGKIKVLVVVSSPPDVERSRWALSRLDEQAALDAIQASLDIVRDRFDFELLRGPASTENIRRHLSNGGFHVLHLFAHGASPDQGAAASVVLESGDGEAIAAGAAEIGAIVGGLPRLRLVVLAGTGGVEADSGRPVARAPSSELIDLAPSILERGIPAVVAMQGRLDDEAGRLFVSTFYAHLVTSKDGLVDQAINQARQKIFHKRRETWAWTAPVLFLRGSGVLFAPAGLAERVAPASPTHQAATPRPEQPRRLRPKGDLRGGKPVLSAGKRIEPVLELSRDLRFIAPTKEQLFDDLVELGANRDRVETFYWLIGSKRQASPMATLDAEYRDLIDTAFETGTAAKLHERIQKMMQTRQKAPQAAQLYDFGTLRATKEFAP